VLCQWTDHFEFMALFVVLICGLVQILFLSLVVNFYFSKPFSCYCSQT
jgi:hypothetical protein